jgi:hypothetical protein
MPCHALRPCRRCTTFQKALLSPSLRSPTSPQWQSLLPQIYHQLISHACMPGAPADAAQPPRGVCSCRFYRHHQAYHLTTCCALRCVDCVRDMLCCCCRRCTTFQRGLLSPSLRSLTSPPSWCWQLGYITFQRGSYVRHPYMQRQATSGRCGTLTVPGPNVRLLALEGWQRLSCKAVTHVGSTTSGALPVLY